MNLSFVVFIILASICGAQEYYFLSDLPKQGVCPAVAGTCSVWCNRDSECPGSTKCCGTPCGGRFCVAPINPSDISSGGGRKL